MLIAPKNVKSIRGVAFLSFFIEIFISFLFTNSISPFSFFVLCFNYVDFKEMIK